MSPTIFDASQNEEKAKREQLEKQIEELKLEAQQKNSNSLPAREENLVSELPATNSETPANSDIPKEVMPAILGSATIEKTEQNAEEKTTSQPVVPSTESQPESETMPETATTTPDPTAESIDETEAVASISNRQPEEYSELLRNKKPTSNPFSAFAVQPVGAHFASQHTNEKILMVLRQHPIVNVRWMLIALVMILVPFTVLPLVPIFAVIPGQYQFFGFIGWYLLTLAFSIENFLHWYFNLYIITDERIVDIDFFSLIYRSISSAKVENIEDTTATTKGVLGAIFNYGDVTIQTAAEKREFEFASVPQPATVTKFINELILEEEREKLEGRVM